MAINPQVSEQDRYSDPIWDPSAIIEPPLWVLRNLSRLKQTYPQRISQEKLLLSFLSKYDVKASIPNLRPPAPPGGSENQNRALDALAGGFYGAFGPGAVAVGSHLSNQKKTLALARESNQLARYNVALSEYNEQVRKWESWKQWALVHPDWPSYVDEYENHYQSQIQTIDDHNSEVDEWYYSPDGQDEIRSLLIAERRQARQELIEARSKESFTRAITLIKIASASIILLAIILAAINSGQDSNKKVSDPMGIETER